jgi:hypothetical protein
MFFQCAYYQLNFLPPRKCCLDAESNVRPFVAELNISAERFVRRQTSKVNVNTPLLNSAKKGCNSSKTLVRSTLMRLN